MLVLFYYSLLLGGALLLMWGAYRIVRMRRLVIGRGILLAMTALSVLAAALPFALAEPMVIVVEPALSGLAADAADAGAQAVPVEVEFSWWHTLSLIYVAGLAVSLLRLIVTLGRIVSLILRSDPHGHVRLHNDSRMVPFAWGRWMVMSRSDFESHGPMLVAHEQAHLRGFHWVDLLVLNVLQCLTWYCPATRLLRGELLAAHECAADRAVLARGFDAADYQMLLISKASGRRFANSVTACINHVSLKNRILMMQNPKTSGRVPKRAFALILPALVLLALASAPTLASRASALLPAVYAVNDESAVAAVANDVTTDTIADKDIAHVVEVAPEYPGGVTELYKFMAMRIKYPEEAAKNGIQGRVIVRFVVNSDGAISRARVERGVSPELDAEALRVVGLLPKWKPGRNNGKPVACWFVMPINFALN